MALCKNCGAKLHRGAKFCSECGAAVGSQDTAITLPKGVYKKELEILPHTTISGNGFSCETDTLADLQSIVVVPEGKSIVINDEATIEGIVFVGKTFYDEHKGSLLSELNTDAQVAFAEQLATADQDWDALCEFSEQNESDALLRILSDNVKLKKVCVIGSPASGIYVGGKAEFSCVSVLQSTASNLVVDSAAEVCFKPLTEEGESTSTFACSLKGHGIVCKGNMNLSGDEQKNNIRICANYNMLQGIRLSGGMNAKVEKAGIVECAGNLGTGLGMYAESVANIHSLSIHKNKTTGILLNDTSKLCAEEICAEENRDGIQLQYASSLEGSDISSYKNSECGLVLIENSTLKADFVTVYKNPSNGLELYDQACAEIKGFEAFENHCALVMEENAVLTITGKDIFEASQIYENETGTVELHDNAKATFNSVQFSSELAPGALCISDGAEVYFENCSFYKFDNDPFAINVSDSASVTFDSCNFGWWPEGDEYNVRIWKLNAGIQARGNAHVLVSLTKECHYKRKYFIQADSTATISTDSGDIKYAEKKEKNKSGKKNETKGNGENEKNESISNENTNKITNDLQKAIDSTPKNGLLKLEADVYKGSFSVNSKITIQGSALPTEDYSARWVFTIIVVPDGEHIVINSSATLEGIIFVGENFYKKYKKNIRDRIELIYEIEEQYRKEFTKFFNTLSSDDRSQLSKKEWENRANALLCIKAEKVKLRKVYVIGSPSTGIYVSGSANFSCVSAYNNQFTNLAIAAGAQVSFVPINKKSQDKNSFSYSYRGIGIYCNGSIILKDNIDANGNMLHGIAAMGEINSGKGNVGCIRVAHNFGIGFLLSEKSKVCLESISSYENQRAGIFLNKDSSLTADSIDSLSDGNGIRITDNSNLNADTIESKGSKTGGVGLGGTAKLNAKYVNCRCNNECGFCLRNNAHASIELIDVVRNRKDAGIGLAEESSLVANNVYSYLNKTGIGLYYSAKFKVDNNVFCARNTTGIELHNTSQFKAKNVVICENRTGFSLSDNTCTEIENVNMHGYGRNDGIIIEAKDNAILKVTGKLFRHCTIGHDEDQIEIIEEHAKVQFAKVSHIQHKSRAQLLEESEDGKLPEESSICYTCPAKEVCEKRW